MSFLLSFINWSSLQGQKDGAYCLLSCGVVASIRSAERSLSNVRVMGAGKGEVVPSAPSRLAFLRRALNEDYHHYSRFEG